VYNVSRLFLPVKFRVRSVRLPVCNETVFWKNGWPDRNAIWAGGSSWRPCEWYIRWRSRSPTRRSNFSEK